MSYSKYNLGHRNRIISFVLAPLLLLALLVVDKITILTFTFSQLEFSLMMLGFIIPGLYFTYKTKNNELD